ncbi:MAG: DUF389 domain-containing protein [Bacteroidales bacterium]|nr:DUF389 domain-containing protein [Bacteroidales bacterium]
MPQNIFDKVRKLFVDYFSLSGQLVSQQEAESAIREGVSFRGTTMLILILAILIASLGLNTNSTAVIIGAMLISPLMGPIIGVGLGVGIHDFDLIKRCLRNLTMAALFSILASTLYFLISPVNEQHSELLARTSPTIYDVLIGFFGGGAGIIALGSTNKGNVLPGVAIATALMPPLCTAGYGLATWQLNYFFGAFYLFVINSIYIAFATFIGVKLMKYKNVPAVDTARARRVRRVVYAAAILTMIPSIYLTYRMLESSRYTARADQFIKDECHFAGTQVISRSIFTEDGEKNLQITLIGRQLPEDSLLLALSSKLKYYGLAGTKLSFIQGGAMAERADNTPGAIADIYKIAQATITRQQSEIDSLKIIIRDDATSADAATEIAPEVKVVFPNVKDLGITTTVFSRLESEGSATDTVSVAMVSTHGRMSKEEGEKLTHYIETRLKLTNVRLLQVSEDFTK